MSNTLSFSSIDARPIHPQYPLIFEAAMIQLQFLALLTALALLMVNVVAPPGRWSEHRLRH